MNFKEFTKTKPLCGEKKDTLHIHLTGSIENTVKEHSERQATLVHPGSSFPVFSRGRLPVLSPLACSVKRCSLCHIISCCISLFCHFSVYIFSSPPTVFFRFTAGNSQLRWEPVFHWCLISQTWVWAVCASIWAEMVFSFNDWLYVSAVKLQWKLKIN